MFKENKYTNWYFNIINSALSRNPTGYIERHHIIPKSFGGADTKENIVKLTAREHFICHRLLTKMVDGVQKRYVVNSRSYETIRSELAKTLSLERKGIMNKGRKISDEQKRILASYSGRKHSEETKAKMKESWKKRPPRTQEHRDAIAKAGLGRKASEETKLKMSATRKGKNPIQTQILFKCEHCGKEGTGASNYKRWHGQNCKAIK